MILDLLDTTDPLVSRATPDTAQALPVHVDPEVFLDHQAAKENQRLGTSSMNRVFQAHLGPLDIKALQGVLVHRDRQALQVSPALKDHVVLVRRVSRVSLDTKDRKDEQEFQVQMEDLEVRATRVSQACLAEALV